VNEEAAVQGRITTFWDAVASGYDSPGNVALPGTAQYANWVKALGSALPDSSARVLDVGTGTGFVARIAAELGHRVTAIDLSAAMLEASAMHDAGLEITYAVGDAVDPAFPAGSFDVVVSRSLLWTLREPETAFRNWYELLSPGGRVVAVYGLSRAAEPGPPQASGGPSQEPTLFERHYTPETQAALPAMHLSDHEPLLRAAAAGGFRDLSARALEIVRGWETSPGSELPYALVGYRPADQ
jgi:SAM-dependent methyltransferase